MPFITLNNDWSRLAAYYNSVTSNGTFGNGVGNQSIINVVGSPKPTIPKEEDTFTLSDDGLIRGGFKNAILATKKDVARIGKFITGQLSPNPGSGTSTTNGYEKFLESIKGYSFFIKQLGLQQTNPRLEKNRGNLLGGIIGAVGGPTRVFTGVGMLASVGGNAFGLHFDRGGLLGVIPANQKYGGTVDNPLSGVVYSNNFVDASTNLTLNKDAHNRLVEYAWKITDEKKNNEITLDGYLGGPNSLYGIVGRTRTISYFDRTTVRENEISSSKFNGFIPLTSKQISEKTSAVGSSKSTTSITVPGYKFTLESKYGVSTNSGPGSSNHKLDAINTINIVGSDVFYGSDSTKQAQSYVSSSNIQGAYGEDLIKFRIEFLNNNTPSNPQPINTDVLAFRAYIDSFDDGMTAKWNGYRYMGRGEEFYVYDGFTRDISVGFTIHAHSPEEMAPLYSKLNYLISAMTPDYNSQLKMRGNIGYLTVGDYLYRQPGVFTDIKLSGMLDGSWETGLDKDGESNGQYQVPRMIKVQLSFKPIHTFLPRRNYRSKAASGNIQNYPAPFITRDTRSYPTKDSSGADNTNNNYLNIGEWKS